MQKCDIVKHSGMLILAEDIPLCLKQKGKAIPLQA